LWVWDARVRLIPRRIGAGGAPGTKYADPFGDGPFTYRKTDDGGFELQSKPVIDGKP
jgi:hypothetical protein